MQHFGKIKKNVKKKMNKIVKRKFNKINITYKYQKRKSKLKINMKDAK